MDDLVGKKLGSYELVRKIGQGGMGVVYEARHVVTRERAAVKILIPELVVDHEYMVRFQHEISALQKLAHPHIIKLFEHGKDGSLYYYAMEYVEGASLDERLRDSPQLGIDETLEILAQTASGLQAAHAIGIIHRDIKPGNILMAEDGAKITDFSIARDIDATRVTTTGGIIGTPEYIAPEQAEGRDVDQRADIYALGVMAYHMFTGRLPFKGKTVLETLQKHRFGMYNPPRELRPDLPSNIVRLIDMMLERDRSKRIGSAMALEREIRKIQEVRARQAARSGQGDRTLVDGATLLRGPATPGAQAAEAEPDEEEPPAPVADHVIPIWQRRSVQTALAVTVLAAVSIAFWVRDHRRQNDPVWLFERAVSYCRDEYYTKAEALFRDVAQRFPAHELASAARENADRIARLRQERIERIRNKDKSTQQPLQLVLPDRQTAAPHSGP